MKLRKRVSARTGVASLYLSYTINGERRYEYLSLYLYPGKDSVTREKNKATLKAAEVLRARREVEVANGLAGIRVRKDTLLEPYFTKYVSTHAPRDGGYRRTLNAALGAWKAYGKPSWTLASVTPDTMRGFVSHLKASGMKENSVARYYDIVASVFNAAVKEGLIPSNPAKLLIRGAERPRPQEGIRSYLTMEEVRVLDATPCRMPLVKSAFLFGCFTGLRISDIRALRWEDVEGRRLTIRMKKTGEVIMVPLSANALAQLPERCDGPIFPLPSHTCIRRVLAGWVKSAGVGKHVTFHTARHTFATLALTYGADIYTVSKLLGHTTVSTTQIYAKVVDRKKEEAVNLIPDL